MIPLAEERQNHFFPLWDLGAALNSVTIHLFFDVSHTDINCRTNHGRPVASQQQKTLSNFLSVDVNAPKEQES